MAEHSRTLHYDRETQTSGVRLYTTQGDVTNPTVITTGNVENEGTLSTTAADDITPALRLMDGNTTVYAQLVEAAGTDEGLMASVNGKNYFALPKIDSITPAQIKAIVNAGLHTKVFNVGDSFPIKLNGTVGIQTFNNETYYATILGFDHNKDLESNGKSSIHFIVGKNANGVDIAFCDSKYGTIVENAAAFHMNMTNTNSGGWQNSYMRNTICSQFKAAIPSNLRNILSSITKYSDNTGGGSDTASYVTATTDDIFLLSEYEIQGARTYANSAEQSKQKQYAYYANGASKVRYKHSDASSAAWWWLRSANYNLSNHFCHVSTSGGVTTNNAIGSGGFAPGFAIVAD